MGSPVSPGMINVVVEEFETRSLSHLRVQPRRWFPYVGDTFVICQNDISYICFPIHQVHRENEKSGCLVFLDSLVTKDHGDSVYGPQSTGSPSTYIGANIFITSSNGTQKFSVFLRWWRGHTPPHQQQRTRGRTTMCLRQMLMAKGCCWVFLTHTTTSFWPYTTQERH